MKIDIFATRVCVETHISASHPFKKEVIFGKRFVFLLTGCLTVGGKVIFGFGSDVPENLESGRSWSVY
jgi:hypothetical protein